VEVVSKDSVWAAGLTFALAMELRSAKMGPEELAKFLDALAVN